jgi:hypothetical protein
MRYQKPLLFLTVLLSLVPALVIGQISGGIGGRTGGLGAAGSGIGGARGLSTPRGGLGFRSNPIANPAPSLTPHEVLNPRGSLNSGQVFNPAPSLRRPRSGGITQTFHQPGSMGGSIHTAVQPSYSGQLRRQPVKLAPVGERLQQSASTLERQLGQIAPDKGWQEYLSVATLRKVQSSSEQPSDSERRELQALLERYESVAADEKYKIISRLPEFQRTVSELQAYLRPIDERRRQELIGYFDRLGEQLRQYTNGESWAEFLALPKELLGDESTEGVSERPSKLLTRFDKLSGNPTYAKVTALPAFRPAYGALKLAVGQSITSPTPSVTTQQQPVAPGDQQPVASDARPTIGDSTELSSTDSEAPRVPVGERILESVVELDRRLAKVAPNSEWPKRLSLDELRGVVSVSSEQPANDSERKAVEDILRTYEAIAKDKENAIVSELPEFKETLEALQEYLKPSDAQPAED